MLQVNLLPSHSGLDSVFTMQKDRLNCLGKLLGITGLEKE
jgi:hypothetical protein